MNSSSFWQRKGAQLKGIGRGMDGGRLAFYNKKHWKLRFRQELLVCRTQTLVEIYNTSGLLLWNYKPIMLWLWYFLKVKIILWHWKVYDSKSKFKWIDTKGLDSTPPNKLYFKVCRHRSNLWSKSIKSLLCKVLKKTLPIQIIKYNVYFQEINPKRNKIFLPYAYWKVLF